MPESPLICKLSDAELRERRALVLDALRDQILEVRRLDDGYALRFEAADPTVEQLLLAIQLERSCCPFIRFRLTVEPERGPIWLELTGPSGAAGILAAEFGLP